MYKRQNVYVADVDGTVSAFLRNGQGARWKNIELGYREMSRPTPVKSYVATVDLEGYLHLLSQVDGKIVGRLKIAGGPDSADTVSYTHLRAHETKAMTGIIASVRRFHVEGR